MTSEPSDRARAVRALARVSRLLERASGDLNLAHYRVLSAIAGGDERASRLAGRLAIGKPTISATVDALCQRGLVERTADPVDQRATSLRLTPAGAAHLTEVEAAMTTRLDELCARTPDPASMVNALGWLADALDADAQARHSGERRSS